MEWLPPLNLGGGNYYLPLSENSASRLAAAWIAGNAAAARQLLMAAIADDPALALWTLLHAPALTVGEWPSLEELAVALVTAGPGPFAGGANQPSAATTDEWAEAAGLSRLVALLAERLAASAGLNTEHAFRLGLLHLAPAWLSASSKEPFSPGRCPQLPASLIAELNRIGQLSPEMPASPADCVATAIALANCEDSALFARHHLTPDDWIGAAARFAEEWGRTGPLAPALPQLAAQLLRLERLESDFARALEAEKLESLKELAQGAGHEINNPLANISARAQTLLPGERDPDRRRLLAAINTQAFRAHEMIADLMLFARPPAARPETVELVGLAKKILVELQPLALNQHTEFVLKNVPGTLTLQADPVQLAVALKALCVNALEALVEGGRVEIELRGPSGSDSTTQIIVSDNGPGIPENVRRHLFAPFYSGREAGRGIGFGLSKCWRIASQHGGRVDVAENPGGGARLSIVLPSGSDR